MTEPAPEAADFALPEFTPNAIRGTEMIEALFTASKKVHPAATYSGLGEPVLLQVDDRMVLLVIGVEIVSADVPIIQAEED